MRIEGDAVILSHRRFGESSLMISLFSREYGLVKGIAKRVSRKKMSDYLAGNLCSFAWQARLEDQLGMLIIDVVRHSGALIMQRQILLKCLLVCISAVEKTIAEREPHPSLFDSLVSIIKQMDEMTGNPEKVQLMRAYVDFEMNLLSEIGFGLDLTRCASTGVRDGLKYISPKTGRAVSEEAGREFHDRLFIMPEAFKNAESAHSDADYLESLKITGYFLEKMLYENFGISGLEGRSDFIKALEKN